MAHVVPLCDILGENGINLMALVVGVVEWHLMANVNGMHSLNSVVSLMTNLLALRKKKQFIFCG